MTPEQFAQLVVQHDELMDLLATANRGLFITSCLVGLIAGITFANIFSRR